MKIRRLHAVLMAVAVSGFLGIGCGGGGGGDSSGGGGGGGGTGSRLSVSVSGTRTETVPVEMNQAGNKVNTPFTQEFSPGGQVTVSAPEGIADRQFQHWQLNGQILTTQPTVQTQAPAGDFSLVAVYTPRACGPNGFTPNYAAESDPQDGQPNSLYWWHDFPVRIYFDETKSLVGQSVIDEILAGFDTWHDVTGVLGAYELTTDAASAHITVRFTYEAERTGVAYTETVFFTDDNTLDKATVTFILSRINPNSFTRIGAHEFGHALGLQGHSSAPSDVMSVPAGFLPLSARDVNTLASGYCTYYSRSGRHSAPRAGNAANRQKRKTVIDCPRIAN